MSLEAIIDEFERSDSIPTSIIDAIENDPDVRHQLAVYFSKYKNRNFVLALLDTLTFMRKDPGSEVSGDSLMLACYLLGKHGQIEDCMKIWETKTIDFDTYCYIDIQLLPFAGVQKTIDYLKTQTTDDAKRALEYVIASSKANDFKNLEQYYKETPWFI